MSERSRVLGTDASVPSARPSASSRQVLVGVLLAPRALAEAKRIKTWWRENRPAAPDLFEQELDAAFERISARPTSVETLYEQGNVEAHVRRVLMPKALNHVYFAVEGDDLVVVSVWGAPRERGPKL